MLIVYWQKQNMHLIDYNGNLTLIHSDVTTPGERINIGISHIYNTNNRNDDSEVGRGFKLNYKQQINLVNINNIEYARFLDEDGTEHYFKKIGNTYIDEDGLNLRLTLENNVLYRLHLKILHILCY